MVNTADLAVVISVVYKTTSRCLPRISRNTHSGLYCSQIRNTHIGFMAHSGFMARETRPIQRDSFEFKLELVRELCKGL